jgi:hypothetical protein
MNNPCACGRITMEGSFTGGFYPELSEFEGNAMESDTLSAVKTFDSGVLRLNYKKA